MWASRPIRAALSGATRVGRSWVGRRVRLEPEVKGIRVLVALAVLAGYGALPTELRGAGQATLPSRPKPPTTITLYVQAGGHKPKGAPLQAQADKRSHVIAVIPNGAAVRAAPKAVIGRDRDHWYKVTYREKTGYVRAALLSRKKPLAVITLYVQSGGRKPRGANLQARPARRSHVELVIPNGTPLRVAQALAISADHDHWYKVTYRGKTGYVRAALLIARGTEATVTLYVTVRRGLRGANLQARPNSTSAVALVIPNGARVRAAKKPVKGTGGQQWYKVTYRGKSGYVLTSLLGPRPPRAPATATPVSGGGARATATPTSTVGPAEQPSRTSTATGGSPPPPATATAVDTPTTPPTEAPRPTATPTPPPTDTPRPTATSTPLPTDTTTPTSTVSPFKRHDPPPTSVPDLFPYTTPATPDCSNSTITMNGPATDLGTYSFDDEIPICFDTSNSPTSEVIQAPVTRPDGTVAPHTVDPQGNLSGGLPGYTWDILPGDPTGQYTVNATEGVASGTGAFTVTTPPAGTGPKILVVPRVGQPGATIRIGLSGFQPGQTVRLYLYRDTLNGDGTQTWAYVTELAPIQTDAQGPTAGQAIYNLLTQPDDYATPGPANEAPNNYLILTDPSTLVPNANADVGPWQTSFAAFCLSGPDPTNPGCDNAGYLLPTATAGP